MADGWGVQFFLKGNFRYFAALHHLEASSLYMSVSVTMKKESGWLPFLFPPPSQWVSVVFFVAEGICAKNLISKDVLI